MLASGRVYPTTNDQPSGLFGTFKSFPRTRTRFGRRDRSVITFTSFTACEAHQPNLWNFQQKTSESFDGWHLIYTCINNYMCVYIYIYVYSTVLAFFFWNFMTRNGVQPHSYRKHSFGNTVGKESLDIPTINTIFHDFWAQVSYGELV